ncbi:hypothetical protein B0T10DRAFT_62157 [Thelonectria olida]|uniref:Uncharacterized protein n=1 Tax=Thelonectria olida TaxID=1576542 RepID=A0A9P8W321_9HYPO|nr:hypothetical protein B0T10DRAFT_62157 [Thelonectria olida]
MRRAVLAGIYQMLLVHWTLDPALYTIRAQTSARKVPCGWPICPPPSHFNARMSQSCQLATQAFRCLVRPFGDSRRDCGASRDCNTSACFSESSQDFTVASYFHPSPKDFARGKSIFVLKPSLVRHKCHRATFGLEGTSCNVGMVAVAKIGRLLSPGDHRRANQVSCRQIVYEVRTSAAVCMRKIGTMNRQSKLVFHTRGQAPSYTCIPNRSSPHAKATNVYSGALRQDLHPHFLPDI